MLESETVQGSIGILVVAGSTQATHPLILGRIVDPLLSLRLLPKGKKKLTEAAAKSFDEAFQARFAREVELLAREMAAI